MLAAMHQSINTNYFFNSNLANKYEQYHQHLANKRNSRPKLQTKLGRITHNLVAC